jgi:hypothetical protein
MYYVSLLWWWHLVMILVRTDHPYLRVGRHSWYQSHYGYNTSRTVLFSKTVVRIRLDAHIKTMVVLTDGKLIGIYLLYLLSTIYFSVMTHLRQGKKVSIIVSGDVNSGPIASRRGLLEAVPIVQWGLTSVVRRVTTAYLGRVETQECLVALPQDVNTSLWRMPRCPCSIKCMGATWGISGDVCYMCILCTSAGTLTTIT